MNTKPNKVPTRFAPERRFELTPNPAVPFRAGMETELERLKDRLLKELLNETENAALYAPLRRAANEAAALAWVTSYPLLFLPALLEEKVRLAVLQAKRQRLIRQRSAVLTPEAA